MTQIFIASTLFGAMTVAAAIDDGRFEGGTETPGPRRILLVSNNTAIPELCPSPDQAPGFAALATRFDTILSWNEVIKPLHPSGWMPRTEDIPMFERLLRERWGLGADPVELIVESIAVNPAKAVAAIFHDAPVSVYSDGLMSYGPTRDTLPHGIGSRVTRLLYLDLIPGLEPQLLAEYGVPAEVLPDAAFENVIAEVGAAVTPVLARHGRLARDASLDRAEATADAVDLTGAPLIVGQYLTALDILTGAEEDDLHLSMLRGTVARGHRTVLFKPHPASPARNSQHLLDEARRLGARLVIVDDPVPAEVWCAAVRPAMIVGCFSTALITATRYFNVPAATVGTTKLLNRLAPYENSNRVPVTIVDTTIPRLSGGGELSEPRINAANVKTDLAPLLIAVAYCMRAAARPDLRREAVEYLETHVSGPMMRYFKRRRLTALSLPGASPSKARRIVNALAAQIR